MKCTLFVCLCWCPHRWIMVSGGSGIRSMGIPSSSMANTWLMGGKFPPIACTARRGASKDLEQSECSSIVCNWSTINCFAWWYWYWQDFLSFETEEGLLLPWFILWHSWSLYPVTSIIVFRQSWCLCRQSQSPAWMGGFGSTPSQPAPPPGSVMSNLASFSMAGYQTQWAGPHLSLSRITTRSPIRPHDTLSSGQPLW